MQPGTRRWVGTAVATVLVVAALGMIGTWIFNRLPGRETGGGASVEREVVSAEPLGPGDLRIYNTDSTVELVLKDDRILAGLSPKTVAKVRAGLDSSAMRDTSGLGGSIARFVKQTVSSAIGAHVAFPLAEIRDLRYEDGRLVLQTRSGETKLFDNTKVDGRPANDFAPDDARRFVEAVLARKSALEGQPR